MMNIIVAVEIEKCYETSISLPLEPRPIACKGNQLLYRVEVDRYDVKELPAASYNTLRVRAMTYIMRFQDPSKLHALRSRTTFIYR